MDQTKQNTMDHKNKPTTSPGGGSAHKDQSTGNFTADAMAACIEEIKRVEVEAAAKGEQPKFKRNSTYLYLYLLLLPRRGALLIKLSYVYSPGTSSNRLRPAVPAPWPPSFPYSPCVSPHLSTETRGESFRSIFKRNRCCNTKTGHLESRSILPPAFVLANCMPGRPADQEFCQHLPGYLLRCSAPAS